MEKKIIFEYDPDLNIVFTDDHWDIKTKEDVDEFFREYKKYFDSLNKKIYMVSHIDDLLVHASVAEYYGEAARATVGKYLLGFARWGSNDWARMTVRTTSLKAKMATNICASREEAIEVIKEIKEKAQDEK